MQEFVISFLNQVNVMQLIAIGIMFWFFYSRLDKKIEQLDGKVDDVDKRLQEVDKRLCRIEGNLAMHGHCLIYQSKQEKVG
jgi:hypothetical protein